MGYKMRCLKISARVSWHGSFAALGLFGDGLLFFLDAFSVGTVAFAGLETGLFLFALLFAG